jgi:hypothetical protein
MSSYVRWLTLAAVPVLAVVMPSAPKAQGNPEPLGFKFNTGQTVQPIFEGWGYNQDGAISMYFGYINRNFVETPTIPVGTENRFEPGDQDRGQPTFFNTRIHRMAFGVPVPKDWGRKELVWSVAIHGVTQKAVGWLQPEWQIDPVYFGKERNQESLKNKPPTLALDPQASVTLPNTLTLTAAVTDDGLPVPKKGPRKAAVGQETPPTLKPDPDQPEIFLNLPQVARGRGRGADQGLVVNWALWRGPASATFEAATTPVKDGKAIAKISFSKPGTYVVRGSANDGELHVERDVTVTVNGPSKTSSQP